MMKNRTRAVSCGWLLVSMACIACTGPPAVAAETKKQRSSKQPSKKPVVSYRLPRYFAALVDDQQRAEIREIQVRFHPKIVALQLELAEMEADQLKELERVLTTSQRKELESMRETSVRTSKAASAKPKSSRKTKSTSSSRSKAKK